MNTDLHGFIFLILVGAGFKPALTELKVKSGEI